MDEIVSTPSLSFSEALNASISKIVQITGRSRRSEYWWTMLTIYVISIFLTPIVGILLDLAAIPLTIRRLHDIGKSGWWYGVFCILKFSYVAFLIYDMVMSYIYHDNIVNDIDNVSTILIYKYAIWFGIICIYQIVLFVFMCMDSEQGENIYGESPKYKTM